jgi:hypothetical protein
MFCIKCGEKLDNLEMFCPGCGTKNSGLVSNNYQILQDDLLKEKDKKILSRVQLLNFGVLIIGLFGLLFPFVTIRMDVGLENLGSIYKSVSPIEGTIGQVIFALIFVAMYLNYVKKFNPLIFLFFFFLIGNSLLYLNAVGTFANLKDLLEIMPSGALNNKLKDKLEIDLSHHPLFISSLYLLSTILTIWQSRKNN